MEERNDTQNLRKDDLCSDGLILWQDPSLPCFSIDALELADYVRLSPKMRCADLGSGTGVIPILAQKKTGARFVGIEKNEALTRLAIRSARDNGQPIDFYTADVKDAPKLLGCGTFDAVTANPPYFASGACGDPSRDAARHDAGDTLEAFVLCASKLLKNGGRFFIIYPANALVRLVNVLSACALEPKRLSFCLFDANGVPKRVLIEAKKGAKSGLTEISTFSVADE